MNEFTVDRKAFLKFLPLFGKELQDITLRIKDEEIEAAVGHMTHYLKARMPATDGDGSTVTINDVPRLITFLKASTSVSAQLSQAEAGKTLHVRCGNSKLQLPSSTYVRSQREVGLIERLVEKANEGLWTKWVSFPLNYSATINTGEFGPAVQMTKVVGDKLSCKTNFSAADGEMVIHAGKGAKAKMFVTVPLIDAEGPQDRAAKSTFGYWLPSLLDCLPPGEVKAHTGEDTVMVFRQQDNFLLIVMDQDYEED